MSHSPDWYISQADLLRGRAEELRAVAARLTDAPVFGLHGYAGEATWQCPAAVAFGEDLSMHQVGLLQAISDLVTNAHRLSNDADSHDRQAAQVREQEQAAETAA